MEKAPLSRSPSLSISSEATESVQEDPNVSRESNLSLISTLSAECLDSCKRWVMSAKREKMSSLLSKVPSNNEIAHAISSYYGKTQLKQEPNPSFTKTSWSSENWIRNDSNKARARQWEP